MKDKTSATYQQVYAEFLAVLEEENITVRKIWVVTDDEINLFQEFIDMIQTVTIIDCWLCHVHWERSLGKWLDKKRKLKDLTYSNPNFSTEIKDQFKIISNFPISPIWMIVKIINIFNGRLITQYKNFTHILNIVVPKNFNLPVVGCRKLVRKLSFLIWQLIDKKIITNN